MKPETLRAILSAVSDGSLSIDDALRQLRRWPIEDL
ncbi:MAG: 1-(5-phosphoribosyl)-5-amino-4-imidazole-carboxylate carboxylase, partial [Candidatus Eisenbacteria bacterium]|nr:1-(5-phosphoribosyl)-5-amino-4-imidazole-carboxylate carboxylase [Candidatus Eisenbacteria bacterium]